MSYDPVGNQFVFSYGYLADVTTFDILNPGPGWTFAWCQKIKDYTLVFSTPVPGKSITEEWHNALDANFPFDAIDYPAMFISASMPAGTGLYSATFDTWLMAKPAGGVYIPVARTEWGVGFTVDFQWANSYFTYESLAQSGPFLAAIGDFPEWASRGPHS